MIHGAVVGITHMLETPKKVVGWCGYKHLCLSTYWYAYPYSTGNDPVVSYWFLLIPWCGHLPTGRQCQKYKHIKHDVSMWKKWTETNDALLNQFLACRMHSSWWKQCQEGSHSFFCNIPLWLYKFGMQKNQAVQSPPAPARFRCPNVLRYPRLWATHIAWTHSAGAPEGPGLASDNKFQQPEPANHWAIGAPMKKTCGLKCPGSIVGEK